MNQVAVKLCADLAARIDSLASTADDSAADVLAVLTEHGADLGPMYSSTQDPEEQTWFVANVGDETSARQLAASLRNVDGVEAAYEQPPAQLP